MAFNGTPGGAERMHDSGKNHHHHGEHQQQQQQHSASNQHQSQQRSGPFGSPLQFLLPQFANGANAAALHSAMVHNAAAAAAQSTGTSGQSLGPPQQSTVSGNDRPNEIAPSAPSGKRGSAAANDANSTNRNSKFHSFH